MPHTIPTEMISEIVRRLPSKSVGRFRCVSKGWLSLLTDPQFIKTHQHTLNQNHLIFDSALHRRSPYRGPLFLHSHPFHYHEGISTTKFNLGFDSDSIYFVGVYISGSCDGLVLVRVDDSDWIETLLLVNPTTRETLQLPEEDSYDLYKEGCEGLGFNTMYGFGHDSVTDDYKVVSLTDYSYKYFDDQEDQVVEVKGVFVHVYSLSNKTWKRAIDSPCYNYDGKDGVFVNGFIHWIARKGPSHDDLRVIVAFSLADESFSEVPSPKLCDATKLWQLVVLGGKLAIFIKSKCELWLMNEYGVGESWTKILLNGFYEPLVLVLYDNGKILGANGTKMMVYEVEKGFFSQTVCVWNPKEFWVIGAYVESLVSLKLNITE